MNQYLAIGVYAGLGLTVFVLGLIWAKYASNVRRIIKKAFASRHHDTHDPDRYHVAVR
jgi:hypothetical protein